MSANAGREPAAHGRVGERLHALCAHGLGPLEPALRRPEVRRGAREHEPFHPVAGVRPQPHADRARRATARRTRSAPRRARRGAPAAPAPSSSTEYGPGGPPSARGRAGRTAAIRNGPAKAASCASQSSSVVPIEFEQTRTGASSGPSKRWWSASRLLPVVGERAVDERLGGADVAARARVRSRPSGRRGPRSPSKRAPRGRRRPAGERERGRERGPLGLPRRLRPARARARRRSAATRSRGRAVRRRAPARPRPGSACAASTRSRPRSASATSPTSFCGQQDDVEPDLPARRARRRRARRPAPRSAPGRRATAPPAPPARARRRTATASSGSSVPAGPPSCAGRRGVRQALTRVDERRPASRPPSVRTWSGAPAGAASGRPSPSSGAPPRARPRPRRLRRARRARASGRCGRRASPRCRGCPGSSPGRARREPARAAPARAARRGSRRRDPPRRAPRCRTAPVGRRLGRPRRP